MTTCERCKTENLDGSQYCDECGAPLGASSSARKKKSSPTGDTGGETNGKRPEQAEVAVAAQNPEPALVAESSAPCQAARRPDAAAVASSASDGPHGKLVIEHGRSAGKQFPLSDEQSQIGRLDAEGGMFPDDVLDADDPEARVARRHA